MKFSFKKVTRLLPLFFFLIHTELVGAVEIKKVKLERVDDLYPLGQEAAKRNIPILLMFTSNSCPWCQRVEKEFLLPMLRDDFYRDQVIIRKYILYRGGTIRDFDGQEIKSSSFSFRYNVGLTPTLLFLDSKGNMLTKKILGFSNEYYYGDYLEEALDRAYAKLNPGAK